MVVTSLSMPRSVVSALGLGESGHSARVDAGAGAERRLGGDGDLEGLEAVGAGGGGPAVAAEGAGERADVDVVEVFAAVDVDGFDAGVGMQGDRSGCVLGHRVAD